MPRTLSEAWVPSTFVWTAAATTDDLDRFETILKDLGAHTAMTVKDGITVVEGRDRAACRSSGCILVQSECPVST